MGVCSQKRNRRLFCPQIQIRKWYNWKNVNMTDRETKPELEVCR